MNVIGAYFTHGPEAGRLAYRSWAVLPKCRARTPRTTPEQRAAAHGLTVEEVGPIDAERLVAFLWQVAGRPADAPPTWRRALPLVVALDNYSVHTSQTVRAAQPSWRRPASSWSTWRGTARSSRALSRSGTTSNSIR